ncbi:unnamed protein product [Aphanomyces euteiches]
MTPSGSQASTVPHWTQRTSTVNGFSKRAMSWAMGKQLLVPTRSLRAYGITDTEKRIANTLKFYGGLKVDVANVVWPGGTIDPWSALGFTNTTKPVNPHSDVVYIEGTAHCADMYSRAKNRAPAWALDRIEANVDSFLRGKC